MGARKCFIEGCISSTNRPEDIGVTYHRIPKKSDIRDKWFTEIKLDPSTKLTKGTFVCSRHFRNADFQTFKGTKYLLRAGAIPSIFPWNTPIKSESESEGPKPGPSEEIVKKKMQSPKSIDKIKAEPKTPNKRSASAEVSATEPQKKVIRKISDSAIIKEEEPVFTPPPTVKLFQPMKIQSVQTIVNFVPGTKIEAQDFNNVWHVARVVEVDTDDREVLIHFEKFLKGKTPTSTDEWIPMDSSRLRPIQHQPRRAPISFVVGEKCVARWSDARKFPATVKKVLENDMYEVLFDDGYVKLVKANHMGKIKKQSTELKPEAIEKKPDAIDWDKIPKPPEGEWACHWYNDNPVGVPSTVLYSEGRTVSTIVVRDDRLPPGWIKHLFQRTGIVMKWEILIASPVGRVFRNKNEMKQYFEERGEEFKQNVFDFSIHRRRAKELQLCTYSPEYFAANNYLIETKPKPGEKNLKTPALVPTTTEPAIEIDGKDFVMLGSVRVKIIDNLFRCPDEQCNKNFRKENHLQIHIKHYHKVLAELLGVFPTMTDLAYLRTVGTPTDEGLPKNHLPNNQFFEKVHQNDIQSKINRKSISQTVEPMKTELKVEYNSADEQIEQENLKKKATILEEALISKTPILKAAVTSTPYEPIVKVKDEPTPSPNIITNESCDPEILIKTHAVHKTTPNRPKFGQYRKKYKSRTNLLKHRTNSRPEEQQLNESFTEFDDTRHSFGSPESGFKRQKLMQQNVSLDSGQDTNSQNTSSIAEQSQSPKYINEDGEVIKIVRMRQEEIINCICTFPEEDGLMIQCELCLCWQHGICNGIERESEVPEKYVCYICRNPHGGRNSMKYKHDQDWLYEGRLPSLHPNDKSKRESRFRLLKQSHTLTGNLLELKAFLHSLKIKINIAEKKDHPKMYLWSKKWESSPIRSELTGVEPLTKKSVEVVKVDSDEIKSMNPELGQILQDNQEKIDDNVTIKKQPDDEPKSEKLDADLLSGLLQTPGGTNIDLSKEDKKDVVENKTPNIPLPEAPIDPTECQIRLLEHIQKQQNCVMSRLQSIEDQIMSLERSNSVTDKLDNENYTRSKQTIQMLIRDLTTMRKIATVNSNEVYGTFI